MRRSYANGRKVLPPLLLVEVQKHWQGMLWIPVERNRRWKTRGDELRNRKIVRGARRGLSTSELARRFALSQERIRQILRQARDGGR